MSDSPSRPDAGDAADAGETTDSAAGPEPDGESSDLGRGHGDAAHEKARWELRTREHHHRNVGGGGARAAVFGASDGLVSTASLVLGVAGADTSQGLVRIAGLAGLVAGAVSMAAGEWVSMKAQRELLERELELERSEHVRNPNVEIVELAEIYQSRGIDPGSALHMAREVMNDPEQALEIHAREELGVDPNDLGNPVEAAVSSFLSFTVGGLLPLLPWFFGGGTAAVIASIVLGVLGAVTIGALLARFTDRPWPISVARQVIIASGAAAITYGIGAVVGGGGAT